MLTDRAPWNACQNPRCGHRYVRHGRCTAYHCHCRGWRPITEDEYQRGKR